MKRLIATAAAVTLLGLPLAALSLAPAANAITNPAANPHPITVKGDDGQTYTDGQDTLPGYDDEACTYIPGAWFDFDNNKVHYADGQSIPWTEWDRATGYAEWKANQDKATATTSAKPSTKATTKATSKPSSGSATGGATSSGTKKSSHSSTSSATADPPAPSASATTSTSATASSTDSVSADPADAATSAPTATGSATAATVADPGEASPSGSTTDAQLTEVSAETDGSSISGFAIIGGLVAVAALLLGGNAVYRRSRKESVQ